MGNSSTKPDYKHIRQQRLQRRNAQLLKYKSQFQTILSEQSLTIAFIQTILNSDLVQLVNLLNSHKATSIQLVAIFGLRATTIGKQLSIITQDYFEYALKTASHYDKQRAQEHKTNWTFEDQWDMNKYFPPLFGIPISIKDNIDLEGTASTIGLSARANSIIKQDGFLAKAIKRAGMIPFMKTNLPQFAMNFDSSNFLWGTTLNPWNHKKSAGGSSGGSAAAVACKMSPISVGNDIGGSLRIPAAYCGISSLKSGPNRLPTMGTFTKFSEGYQGMDMIKLVTGPMSTTVDGLALWMISLTQSQFYGQQYDPYMKLTSFDVKLYKQIQSNTKKLKIGFITDLSFIECTPACRRGLLKTVQHLKRMGHELIQIDLPNQRETILCMNRQITGQGGFQSYHDMLQGQDLVREYSGVNHVVNLGWFKFKWLQYQTKHLPRIKAIVESSKKITTHQYLVNSGRAHALRPQWIQFWRQNQLDFIVSPGFGSEATNHGMSNDAFILAAYTWIWNVLGMSACSIPVTVVRQDEQYYQSKWDDPITNAIKISAIDSVGLPVNVQIVGLPFEEERVLGLSKMLQTQFQFCKQHPLPNV